MRISDWSSDVCSSDLLLATSFVVRIDYARVGLAAAAFVALPLTLFRESDLIYSLLVLAILAVNIGILARLWLRGTKVRFSAEEEALRGEHFAGLGAAAARDLIDQEIGRASCRERVCQYV